MLPLKVLWSLLLSGFRVHCPALQACQHCCCQVDCHGLYAACCKCAVQAADMVTSAGYEYEHVDLRTLSDAQVRLEASPAAGPYPAPHLAPAPPGPQLEVASQAAAAHPPAHQVATPPAPQTVPQAVVSSSGCTTKVQYAVLLVHVFFHFTSL